MISYYNPRTRYKYRDFRDRVLLPPLWHVSNVRMVLLSRLKFKFYSMAYFTNQSLLSIDLLLIVTRCSSSDTIAIKIDISFLLGLNIAQKVISHDIRD